MTSPIAADAINRPGVVAEVAALFADYEAALLANDVAAMDGRFWASDLVVRYGVADEQYGAEAVAAWRRGARPVPTTRAYAPTVVTTFGDDLATVNIEFDNGDGSPRGRQSQTWVRFEEGWRIVSAHVSQPPRVDEIATA